VAEFAKNNFNGSMTSDEDGLRGFYRRDADKKNQISLTAVP
jgi:hypothetical protein